MIRKSIVKLEELSFLNFEEPINTETNSEVSVNDSSATEEVVEEIEEFRYTTHYIESVDGVTTKVSINDMGEEVTSYDKNFIDFWNVNGGTANIVLDNDCESIIAISGAEIKVKIDFGASLIAEDSSKFNVVLSDQDNIVFIDWTSGSEFIFNDFEVTDQIQLADDVKNYDIKYDGKDSIINIDGEAAITIKNFHFTDDNMFIL